MAVSEIRRFRRTLRRFERVTHAQVKSCCAHVTLAQCLVLLEIDESGQLTMSQLASRLRLDVSTLSRTIEALVQRGVVERLRQDQDRRVIHIRLTSEGHAVCRSIHKEQDGLYVRIFESIPPSRRQTVIKNFEILTQAFLDQEVEPDPGAPCGSTVSSEKEASS